MTDVGVAQPSPFVEACRSDRLKLILALGALGYLILITAIYAYCVVRGIKIEGEAAGALGLLAGLAISTVKDCYGFVFGSSQGSENKSTQIAAMVPAAPVKEAA